MEILGLRSEVPRRPVGQILTHPGHPKIALVDLGTDASKALRASWPEARPFQSGGAIESAWLLPLLGAGSAAGASLLAGNVLLATANPATLMTIGAGGGSAVMGPTGIVAAAPFVAAKGVLMPVVAPVIRFTTVSSLMIGARLDRVQKALGRLFEVVEGMRRRMEAEEYDLARLKLSRVLGRGRALAARTRNVRNIRKDFNSIRARMKSWTDAFESAIDESREPSILFYREPDGEQELRAYHTRDLRLQEV